MRLSGLAIAQVFISVLYLVVQNAIKERKKERWAVTRKLQCTLLKKERKKYRGGRRRDES
jgi:hypothetical protein